MYTFITYSMMFLHTFVGIILIGVILLQRGRGGGLAGAFGGMGGQSAFGTKAGDVFTRITIVLATVWIVLGCVCVLLASNYDPKKWNPKAKTPAVKVAPAEDGEIKPDGDAADSADDKPRTDETPKNDDQSDPPKAEDKNGKPAEPASDVDKNKDADVTPAKESPDKDKPPATESPDKDAADKKPE